MTARPKRAAIRVWAVVGLLLSIAFVALAQGNWGLGPYTLISGPPSGPLRYSMAKSGGLGSYGFVSGVGGVAFGGIARPDAALAGKAVTLHYDNTKNDGHHLQVTTSNSAAAADLPDWVLVPIVKFADSEFDACVSLFGPNTSEQEYDIVYHESFQNTLLGLRLLEADMILFNLSETWRLPQQGGIVVLGLGERSPTQIDAASAGAIQAALSGGDFQSWVMTDQGEDVVFTLRNGSLELSGSPYYYF